MKTNFFIQVTSSERRNFYSDEDSLADPTNHRDNDSPVLILPADLKSCMICGEEVKLNKLYRFSRLHYFFSV